MKRKAHKSSLNRKYWNVNDFFLAKMWQVRGVERREGNNFEKRRTEKGGRMEESMNLNMSSLNCNQYNKDREIDRGQFNNADCQQNSIEWKQRIRQVENAFYWNIGHFDIKTRFLTMESTSREEYETNLDYLVWVGYIKMIIGDNEEPIMHLSPEGKQWVEDNGDLMTTPVDVYCWAFKYIILTTTTSSPSTSILQFEWAKQTWTWSSAE